MIAFPASVKVWIAGGITDMRRGMNTLALQIQEGLPCAGETGARRWHGVARDRPASLHNLLSMKIPCCAPQRIRIDRVLLCNKCTGHIEDICRCLEPKNADAQNGDIFRWPCYTPP
jgi:hypothetical protein